MDALKYEAMAKLNLNEAERARISEYADALFRECERLEEINTDGVEPLVSALDLTNVTRGDVIEKNFARGELTRNAPAVSGSYYETVRTID